MDQNKGFFCPWANQGLALHNSGAALLCCHSRTFLRDDNDQEMFLHTHTLEDMWNSKTRKEIQHSLENGIQHPNCNACWDEENTGGTSRRQYHNNLNINYSKINNAPVLLDLKLGNVCNLSCRTCNPWVSSQWVKDWWLTVDSRMEKETSVYPTFEKYSKEKFKTWRLSYDDANIEFWTKLHDWIQYAQYIDIYGAEPMLIHKLFDILEHSISQGSHSNQTLHFNTNGTIWNQKYIDILKQFKEVYFDLSIDGLFNHYDYIRNGETWDVVLENINRYDQFKKEYAQHTVSICITVSFFNIYYIDEIFEYFEQRGWVVHFNMAHLPQHVNIKVMPEKVKQAVKTKLLQSKSQLFLQNVQPIIAYMDESIEPRLWEYNIPIWPELVRITNELDVLRKQNFQETFPEFYNLVKEFWTTE